MADQNGPLSRYLEILKKSGLTQGSISGRSFTFVPHSAERQGPNARINWCDMIVDASALQARLFNEGTLHISVVYSPDTQGIPEIQSLSWKMDGEVWSAYLVSMQGATVLTGDVMWH